MKEILEKAIQKAIGGGWNKPPVIIDPRFRTDWPDNYNDFIWRHDFAKALWGNKSYILTIHDVNTPSEYANSIMVQQPMWSYRLQQMVIADDPIEYLGKHI